VTDKRLDTSRVIRAPHGTALSAKSWLIEAPLRMLMNNLDPDVAERTPLKTSEPLQLAPTTVREQIAFYDEDRYFAPDIAAAKAMIVAGVIAATASDKIAL
jgi:hypothetical protein